MIELLDRKICCNYREFLSVLCESEGTITIHTLNMEHLNLLCGQDNCSAVLDRDDLYTVDGRWTQFLLEKSTESQIELVSGSRFLFETNILKDLSLSRVALIGGSEQSNAGAVDRLQELYPMIQFFGYTPRVSIDGSTDGGEMISVLKSCQPQVLLLMLGLPKQERFAKRYRSIFQKHGVRFAFCLGGTVDFLSGAISPVPRFVIRLRLEAIYRLLLDRSRMKRLFRLLVNTPRVVRVLFR